MPTHLEAQNCYICGLAAEHHGDAGGHVFWSNADAAADFAKGPQGPGGAEARYVAEHRPY
jgi:hypothetical protein